MSAATDRHAILADQVFDGETLHESAAVVIEGGRVARLVPRRELPAGIDAEQLPPNAWLAPGFIDVQVNGGGDILFNAAPTRESLAAIAAAHRKFGTTAMLPTLITDRPESMAAARDAVQAALGAIPEIIGVHYEGPFIAPGRRGVHAERFIRKADAGDYAMLTSLAGGVTVVTLAPEEAPPGFIAKLAQAGVKVCFGHSLAGYDATRRAIADGLSGFTHLFNAMPPLHSREPGPVAAALETPGCWYGLIVDGIHVHPAMLKLALRGKGQAMLVTDAMPPVGGSSRSFTLYDEPIEVADGRCVRRDGTLAGAMLDMASAVRNCVRWLDVPLPQALRMASTAPAAFLGLTGRLGCIAPGCRADFVALEPGRIEVLKTWVAGKR